MFASCEVNEEVCWGRKDKIYSLVLQRILCHLSSWSSCHHHHNHHHHPHHPPAVCCVVTSAGLSRVC